MRVGAVILGWVCVSSAASAVPPIPAVPYTGLDLIQARYAGTYKVDETTSDTEFSRAGSRQYVLTRDCAVQGAALDCKLIAEGTVQGDQEFIWDPSAGVYHVEMTIGDRHQPTLTLSVKGDTWTFLQEIQDRDGKPLHYRIVRQYHSATEVSYSAGFSHDGTSWVLMTRGTELRSDEGK